VLKAESCYLIPDNVLVGFHVITFVDLNIFSIVNSVVLYAV